MTSLFQAAHEAGQPSSSLPAQKPHIFICTPCHSGKVDLNYHVSIMMMAGFLHHHGVDYTTDYNVGMSIDNARSEMATLFLRKFPECTHLLFIDDDISFAPDLPYRMLRENVDIVSVPYRRKQTKVLYNIRHGVRCKTLPGRPHMVAVENIATGMMMIRRNVFETLASKVPEYKHNNQGETGLLFFRHDIVEDEMVGGIAYMGEDYNFCRLARANGFDLWAFVDEELAHIGPYAYRGNYREEAEKGTTDTFNYPDPKLYLRLLLK